MEYRMLPHGCERISIIGLGMGSIHNASEREIEDTVCFAIDQGVNFFDFVPSEEKPFVPYARAFRGNRDKVLLQVHLGADYSSGKYGWTRDAATVKREFRARLDLLETDYADFGFIHCMDEESDFNAMFENGIWDYALKLKERGDIRHLGFSSHNPAIARCLIETGLIDLCMFSINPAYDYSEGSYGIGGTVERMALYRECEQRGVSISVMKAFGGGQLLDARTSPFGRALTKTQCIAYALDKPGVVTVLPGIRGKQDLTDCLAYLDATPEERDYSIIGTLAPQDAVGNCVYCNHCQPCPCGIDVGMVNKYYDLAVAGDALAANHYDKLDLHASDCSQCGHCDSRCPFSVKQTARMIEIAGFFGL